jgi:hypothetical protein
MDLGQRRHFFFAGRATFLLCLDKHDMVLEVRLPQAYFGRLVLITPPEKPYFCHGLLGFDINV